MIQTQVKRKLKLKTLNRSKVDREPFHSLVITADRDQSQRRMQRERCLLSNKTVKTVMMIREIMFSLTKLKLDLDHRARMLSKSQDLEPIAEITLLIVRTLRKQSSLKNQRSRLMSLISQA